MTFRLIILTILYFPIWILGTLVIGDLIPDTYSEPGLMSDASGMLTLGLINTVLIVGLIVSSRWYGWRLMAFLALAYYGSFTFMTQIETWYFLTQITVSPELLPRLFLMGLSIPLIYIPIAILICDKWKRKGYDEAHIEKARNLMPLSQLLIKLGVLAIVYLVIYWLAGYFIAWQNPELRAFYGSPGKITPFIAHTVKTFTQSPGLVLLQLVRGVLFGLIVLPLIIGSNVKPWLTGLLVAFLLAVPHLGHLMPNPLMPIASVRLSHMIETATSTFIFGLIVVWLLHRRHYSIKDLFYKK
ncbi:MAG: hypothetical protein EA393_12985 [Bacteroidetes bacterium]|nr:MAG: hypothetical protein EA393_12985 [Bacteroidota bacterium]